MTTLKLFQTERVCRQKFKFVKKCWTVLQKGRKHCGKRRNHLLLAVSPFPTVYLKRLVLQTRKNKGLFGRELNHTV